MQFLILAAKSCIYGLQFLCVNCCIKKKKEQTQEVSSSSVVSKWIFGNLSRKQFSK